MNSRLGIFDSGVGGFTVLKKVVERHGNLPCLYLGDNERVPYGEKTASESRVIAEEIVRWLSNQGVFAVLVACNTTNSLALDVLKKHSIVPVFDLVSSISGLINESDSRLGVLATPSTVFSKSCYTDFCEI